MLKQISDHITEQTGEKVVAKPFVRILDLTSGEAFYHFMEPYTVRFEAGYPVAADTAGAGEIHRRKLAGGETVTALIPDTNLGQGHKQFP